MIIEMLTHRLFSPESSLFVLYESSVIGHWWIRIRRERNTQYKGILHLSLIITSQLVHTFTTMRNEYIYSLIHDHSFNPSSLHLQGKGAMTTFWLTGRKGFVFSPSHPDYDCEDEPDIFPRRYVHIPMIHSSGKHEREWNWSLISTGKWEVALPSTTRHLQQWEQCRLLPNLVWYTYKWRMVL